MDKDELMQQFRDEYERVMQRVFRYFWAFALVGAVSAAYLFFTTDPHLLAPLTHLPEFFWLLII